MTHSARRGRRIFALASASLLALTGTAAAATTSKDTTPPTAPTAYESFHTSTSIQVGWFNTTDDVGIDTLLISDGTTIWESPAWQQWWRILSGLATNRTYTLTVRARDAAGNVSAPSNPVSVFIEDVPPTPPRNLRLESGRLVWDPATDNSGTIARYSVFVDGVARIGGRTDTSSAPLQVLDPITGQPSPGPGTHVFTVKATDPSGNVSAPSNGVTVEIR